ncbi:MULTISPECIES: hypothetical protein [unclassified Roseitalea]|uniref:hypothetical protein n=1 Tax=unclassified Roseitalea TaxID=2639107 RepID=UPI00273EA8E2|nr:MULTISPECIES: hypothetical protein [unclassified Roseitalea]
MDEVPIDYGRVTEAVGLFHSEADLQAAIDDLLTQGFDRSELSLMASEHAVIEKLHGQYMSARDIEDSAQVPTTAYVARESYGALEGGIVGALIYVPALVGASAVVASGGALAAAIAAAAIYGGVGAALGTVLAGLVGKRRAREIADHLERGGLLLWVRTRDPQHEKRALAIMDGHNAADVHVHTLPSLSPGGEGRWTQTAEHVGHAGRS